MDHTAIDLQKKDSHRIGLRTLSRKVATEAASLVYGLNHC